MNARRWLFLGLVVLTAACGSKKSDKESDETEEKKEKKSAKETETADAPKPPATPAPVTTEAPPTPAGIEPHVKAELDGRKDGLTGSPLPAAGAMAVIQTPADWTRPKSPIPVAVAKDDKARIAVNGFTGDPTTKVTEAATAAGLTNCQWGPPETVSVGKDPLPGTAADGICSRGAGQVKAAMMAVNGLAVVGSWDQGGDMANVFASMRSVTKAAGGTDSIAACCAALRSNAKSAPPQQMGLYMMAAGTCDSLKSNPQARQMLGQVRAALAGASVPASCK